MDGKAEELAAVIREIRDRVRSRHPNGTMPGDLPLPDLLPIVHARDAAEGKVAAIGTVNPRGPGLVNTLIQKVKRTVARSLDWHVREQIEFNRAMVNCVQAAIEVLNENNRALTMLAGKVAEAQERSRGVYDEMQDVRSHWSEWRPAWEQNLSNAQIQFLRSLSDLQGAWNHRVTLLDETHRGHMQHLHGEFQAALERANVDIQKRLWADLDRMRTEYEEIIQAELRLLRQKTTLMRAGAELVQPSAAAQGDFAGVDWLKFGEKFRGTPEYVKRHLQIYADRFAGSGDVLDIGCGRGELLETLKAAGIPARGIDLNPDCIALCAAQGLEAEKADLFEYLESQSEGSIGGIVCLQVIEHLPPDRLPVLVKLAHSRLRRGGLFALETPNPECLAIFARHFYLDPTHTRPIPPALLAFYLEEAGFGRLETLRLEPAAESMPSLESLPPAFRDDFFGALDYALFGRKL